MTSPEQSSERTRVDVSLESATRCKAVHEPSGRTVRTDLSVTMGGRGDTFSSTDLLSAALGTCIGSSIGPVLEREGIPLDRVHVSVAKEVAGSPRRLVSLGVTIALAAPLEPKAHRKIMAAARSCLVHRSLSPDVVVTIDLLEEELG